VGNYECVKPVISGHVECSSLPWRRTGAAQQLERHKVAEKRPVQSKFLVLLLNLLEEFAADELKPHGPSEVKFIRPVLQK